MRLLRALCLEPFPVSRSELGRLAGLETKGAHLAANRLLREGVLRMVGRGLRQQVELEDRHPLIRPIQELFRAEQARIESVLEALRESARELAPQLMAAWIQGGFARGDDRPEEPLTMGVLAGSKNLSSVVRTMRNHIGTIEASQDITIEIVGYTQPDLATMKPREIPGLSDSLPLFGPPPLAFSPITEEHRALRNAIAHGDREKEQLLLLDTIVDRILRDPAKLRAAKEYVSKRLAVASEHERHELREWDTILNTMSGERLRRFLFDPGERAQRLRQTMPFLDILSPKEREEILHLVRPS